MIEPAGQIAELRAEFDRCWSFLEPSVIRTGRAHDKHHLWNDIVNSRAFFFPGKNCAILCHVYSEPTGLKRLQFTYRGGALQEILKLTQEVEVWGRERGCHQAIGYGRAGWIEKEPGYKNTGIRRTKTLTTDEAARRTYFLD